MEKMTRKLLSRGIFTLDKPKYMYSMDAVEKIKEILITQIPQRFRPSDLRLGHGGTLDSSATGVLVVGVGMGCKQLKHFLHGNKTYRATGKLGEEMDTYNDTGTLVSSKKFDHVTKKMIDERLTTKYVGEIWQTPPKYSALKMQGRRASDLVLEGHDVQMKPRKVKCLSAICTKFQSPYFDLEVSCGGGFYIRSLVHDLGKDLNSCAHLTDLRRTQQGPFNIDDALPESNWTASDVLEAIFYSTNLCENYGKASKQLW